MKTIDGKLEYVNALKDIVKERLAVGQVIPSYKKLCEILGEETKGGDSRKAQKKLWETCFESKSGGGNKIVITGIYKDAKPIIDERDGNGIEFIKYTLPLMLGFLSQHNGKVSISRTKLMEELYFFKNNWGKLRDGNEQSNALKKYRDDEMTVGDIWDLYDTAGASFRRTIEEVINYMGKGNWDKKRHKFIGMELIEVEKGYVFVRKMNVLKKEKNDVNAFEVSDSEMFGMPAEETSLYTEKMFNYEATQEEVDIIKRLKRDMMTDDGKESNKDIKGRAANFKFQRNLEETICEMFDCERYYEKYNITYNKYQVDNLLKIGNYKELQTEFNEKMALNQSINAHNRRADAFKAVAMINSEQHKYLLSLSKKPFDEIEKIMRSDELTPMEKRFLSRLRPQFISLADKIINDRILVDGSIEEIRDRNGVVFIDENYNLLDDSDNEIVALED